MKTEENNTIPKYWTSIEVTLLARATTIKELTVIAKTVLKRMMADHEVIVQVCGPISSGGKGSVEENLKEFKKAIAFLKEQNLSLFDQMPFEDPMQEIKTIMPLEEAQEQIMNDFHLALIKEGFFERYFFMPDWESSKGACKEHKWAKEYGIVIDYLDDYDAYHEFVKN